MDKKENERKFKWFVYEAVENAIADWNKKHGTDYSLEYAKCDDIVIEDEIRDGDGNVVMTIAPYEGGEGQ